MVFDFLRNEAIDVIAWTDDTRDTMVWRFERRGAAIKYGAKLTVREGQAAVFVHEGQLADVFKPGLYMLETNNMPVMTTLQHWHHGFQSPFQSEVYFVATRRFTDQKWGTKNPVMMRDPEFGPVRLRAFGTYAVRVTDPGRFLQEIVGTDGEFSTQEITFQIRNIIVQEFSRVLAGANVPVLDMAANTQEMGRLVAEAISETIQAYGLALPELYIENISLPPAVEAALDQRTKMGIVGDLGRFQQYAAAEAMTEAARNPGGGGGMGAGLGAGMGMAMAREMGRGPWGATPAGPAAAPAPPPPEEHVWHVAEGGKSHGPYSKARLGRMAAEGALTRETHVWTAGQDGWMRAGEVDELARLFTVMPPPPPDA